MYVSVAQGTFGNGDIVGDYGAVIGEIPNGYTLGISTTVVVAGQASARIQDIHAIGVNKRLYLSDIKGTWNNRDGIIGGDNYKSAITNNVELKARVKRSFRGFDGVQTNFKLTANGTPYFPDLPGHMLIFINGILQPPGATNAFTAFSDHYSIY